MTVAELAALLTAMQLMPRLRGQPATKDKLLGTLREAMEAQPAHADHEKVRRTEPGELASIMRYLIGCAGKPTQPSRANWASICSHESSIIASIFGLACVL